MPRRIAKRSIGFIELLSIEHQTGDMTAEIHKNNDPMATMPQSRHITFRMA
jgi:hypothetical protein